MKRLRFMLMSCTLVWVLTLTLLTASWLLLPTAPAQADSVTPAPARSATLVPTGLLTNTTVPTFPLDPLLTPSNGITVTTPWPTFDWVEANDPDGVVSYTLHITGSGPAIWGQATTATITSPVSIYTATQFLPNGPYTWTVQAYDSLGGFSDPVTPTTFIVEAPLTFPPNPLLAPANGITLTTARPTFAWLAASSPTGAPLTYTLLLTSSGVATNVWGQTTTATVALTESTYQAPESLAEDIYTWTVRAEDEAGNRAGSLVAHTFTVKINLSSLYLPLVLKDVNDEPPTPLCPTTSINLFETIPIAGSPADRPDSLHADLNFSRRGYVPTVAPLDLVDYSGSSDGNAPQLAGLFGPNRLPVFSAAYQANGWDWGCGAPHGCVGPTITSPPVTVLGMTTTPGELIFIPERTPEIFVGNYRAMVLYAEERRLTLGYTRQDTVANGYAVHLENVCVDPNLLALYRAQVNDEGWHVTGQLPGLRNNQPLGTALDTEIQVVIRDRGAFMDPRSRKDWWQGY